MKTLIASFSATGNTDRLVGIIGNELEKSGQTVVRIVISKSEPPPADCGKYDQLIVAFPVLAKMPPTFIQKWLRSLPSGYRMDGSRISAVVCATMGGKGGVAALWASRLLQHRGYDVRVSCRILYPDNWTQVGLGPRDDVTAEKQVAAGDLEARKLAALILSGERQEDRVSTGTWIFSQVLGFVFGFFGRRFMGKLFVTNNNCTLCGLCERSCPSKTIVLKKRHLAVPFWRMNCENCNRCINICPKGAINTSILNFLLLCAAIGALSDLGIHAVNRVVSPVLSVYLPGKAGDVVHVTILIAVVVIAQFLVVGPVDFLIFRWFRQIPGLRKVFAISFAGKARRYMAPGFKPGK